MDSPTTPARPRLEELEPRETPAFLALPAFTAGLAFPKVVAAGDFNGDGKADLAVGNETGGPSGAPYVQILIGNGDGTFATGQALADPALNVPRQLALADLNGDGRLDLAVATSQGTTGTAPGGLLVFLGNGDGTFTRSAFATATPALGVAAADFTGDGLPDLAVLQPAAPTSTLQVYVGTGAGLFTAGPAQSTTLNVSRLVAADFDTDTRADVAGLDTAGGNLVAYYGAGTGAFGAPAATALGATPNDLAAGDFDGDGRPDVVVSTSVVVGQGLVNRIELHANPGGQGGFAAAGTDVLPAAGLPPIDRLAVADVDRNGVPDVVALAVGRAFVAANAGGGAFTADAGNPYLTPPMFTAGDVTTGDADGDGNVDFMTVGQDSLGGGNAGDVFLNLAPDATRTDLAGDPNPVTEGQSFTLTATVSPQVTPLPAGAPPAGSVQFVTGQTVLGSAPVVNGVATLPVSGLAAGTYPITATYTPTGPAFRPSASAPLPEVVQAVVLPPTTFRIEVTGGPDAPGEAAYRVASGFFNADGVPDVVLGSGVGVADRVQVIDGASRTVVAEAAPFGDGFAGGVFVAAGDVDGDGAADVAAAADVGGGPRVVVLLSRGGALVPVADFFAVDSDFRGGLRVALGDVNRDGFADLVVSAGPGGGPRVATYDGRSLRAGQTPTRLWNDFFAFESNSRMGVYVAVGDVNNDGFGDIVCGAENGGGPRVTVFDGGGLTGGSVQLIGNFFSGPVDERFGVRVAAGDADLDGRTEVITGDGLGAGTWVRAYDPEAVLGAAGPPAPELEQEMFPGLDGGVFVAASGRVAR